MKETVDSTSAQQSGDEENFANRKLIRPTLPRPDHNHGNHSTHNSGHMQVAERRDRSERHERPERGFEHGERGDRSVGSAAGRKEAPPHKPTRENFFFSKKVQRAP